MNSNAFFGGFELTFFCQELGSATFGGVVLGTFRQAQNSQIPHKEDCAFSSAHRIENWHEKARRASRAGYQILSEPGGLPGGWSLAHRLDAGGQAGDFSR